jgi:hypothetical protein
LDKIRKALQQLRESREEEQYNNDFVQEIILPQSILPSSIHTLVEWTVKNKGEVWRIHNNDADPFPSNPHAHNVETGCKLDLSNGKLYQKSRDTGERIKYKELINIRSQIQNIILPDLEIIPGGDK